MRKASKSEAAVPSSWMQLLLHPIPGELRPPGSRKQRFLRLLRVPVLIELINILAHLFMPAAIWSHAISWGITAILLVFIGYAGRAVEKMSLHNCLQVGYVLFGIWYGVSILVAFMEWDLPWNVRERYYSLVWALVACVIYSLVGMILTGIGVYLGLKMLRRAEPIT